MGRNCQPDVRQVLRVMRIELDERYLPCPEDVGPYVTKLLVGTGNDITMRWAPWRNRDPFPFEAEMAYWNALPRCSPACTSAFLRESLGLSCRKVL